MFRPLLALLLIFIAGCSSTVGRTVPASLSSEAPYEGATKMNALSVGMTKSEVLSTIGMPATTAARRDIECAEYVLREHNENYIRSAPTRYHVTLVGGHVAEFGEGACTPYFMEQAGKQATLDSFHTLSIGMSKADVLGVLRDEPYASRREDKFGLECLTYRLMIGAALNYRFVAFKNGKVIALGESTCDQEADPRNFEPGGKYRYLLSQ